MVDKCKNQNSKIHYTLSKEILFLLYDWYINKKKRNIILKYTMSLKIRVT